MLDVVGSTFPIVIDTVLRALVAQGMLEEDCRELAIHALSGASLHHPGPAAADRASPLPNAGERTDWAMLEPDSGEEALDLLLAHVPFVYKQVSPFSPRQHDTRTASRPNLSLTHTHTPLT